MKKIIILLVILASMFTFSSLAEEPTLEKAISLLTDEMISDANSQPKPFGAPEFSGDPDSFLATGEEIGGWTWIKEGWLLVLKKDGEINWKTKHYEFMLKEGKKSYRKIELYAEWKDGFIPENFLESGPAVQTPPSAPYPYLLLASPSQMDFVLDIFSWSQGGWLVILQNSDKIAQWVSSDDGIYIYSEKASEGKNRLLYSSPLEGWNGLDDKVSSPPLYGPTTTWEDNTEYPSTYFGDELFYYQDKSGWRIYSKVVDGKPSQELMWEKAETLYFWKSGKAYRREIFNVWYSGDAATIYEKGKEFLKDKGIISVSTIGAGIIEDKTSEKCKDLYVGITGASNTAPGYGWAKYYLRKKLCAGSQKINVEAIGGYAPNRQLKFLTENFLKPNGDPLDILIINPSGNMVYKKGGQCTYSKTSLIKMVDRAQKVGVKKIYVTTISPRNNWQSSCVKKFNNELLNSRGSWLNKDQLGVVKAIDLGPALEDPIDKDKCAYCNSGDQRHWNSEGHARVGVKVYQDVYIAQTGLSSSQIDELRREWGLSKKASGTSGGGSGASSVPSVQEVPQNCQNGKKCKEIDQAWLKVSDKLTLNAAIKGNIFVVDKGWMDFDVVYPVKKEVSSSSGASKGDVGLTPKEGACVAQHGSPEERALLDTIGLAELGSDKAGRYDYMVTFKQIKSLKGHPVETGEITNKGICWKKSCLQKNDCSAKSCRSTGAGRYQFLWSTYSGLKKNKEFVNGFYPLDQDKGALKLAHGTGVSTTKLKQAIKSDDFWPIWDRIAPIWASFPKSGTSGGVYGQLGKSNNKQDIRLKTRFKFCLQQHLSQSVA